MAALRYLMMVAVLFSGLPHGQAVAMGVANSPASHLNMHGHGADATHLPPCHQPPVDAANAGHASTPALGCCLGDCHCGCAQASSLASADLLKVLPLARTERSALRPSACVRASLAPLFRPPIV